MNSLTPRTDARIQELMQHAGLLNDKMQMQIINESAPWQFARQLETELNELRAWKAEALIVESEWDEQALAKLLGAPLGVSCRKFIAQEVPKLLEENTRLRQQLLSSSVKTSDKT